MQEFQDLYEKYNQYIYKFLLKLTNFNADLADELTQETFYQVFLSLHKYRGEAGILTWICAIGKNVCCKYYRKNPSMLELNTLDRENQHHSYFRSMEEVAEQKELSAGIIAEIMKLDEKYRDVLIYRLYFELTFREISELMNIKENSAKVLYHRGKNMVREKMEGYFDE
ncbi:sigma-70 family RNA polymerase sigma factor [Blautia schinkii]|nr:sigma-70 family RNA polymerase sigma factor [Blautia schinkii]